MSTDCAHGLDRAHLIQVMGWLMPVMSESQLQALVSIARELAAEHGLPLGFTAPAPEPEPSERGASRDAQQDRRPEPVAIAAARAESLFKKEAEERQRAGGGDKRSQEARGKIASPHAEGKRSDHTAKHANEALNQAAAALFKKEAEERQRAGGVEGGKTAGKYRPQASPQREGKPENHADRHANEALNQAAAAAGAGRHVGPLPPTLSELLRPVAQSRSVRL